MSGRAEVPHHGDPYKQTDDFIATNKSLRACFVCRLVKSENQFFSNGCDNCEKFLKLEGDREKVQGFTTNAFAGVVVTLKPSESWASKWLHVAKCKPGSYALVINEDMPEALQDYLERRNIRVSTS